MRTWGLFSKLQAEYAYGEALGGSSPAFGAITAVACQYLVRMHADSGRPLERALVIGPGGPDEVRQLTEAVHPAAGWFALSSHAPEVEALRALPLTAELGDMHDMPYQSGAFDLVYASNVLEHALAPYCALMEIRRVLRPGGIAYLVMPSFAGPEGGAGPFHLHCLSREVWFELLRKTGLGVADVVRQPGVDDSDAHYWHFRCLAHPPPPPHDRVLRELVTCKASL